MDKPKTQAPDRPAEEHIEQHPDDVQGAPRTESPSEEPPSAPEESADIATGTQTGQLGRGSYSTDPATGAGRYADHRSGTFGTDDVAQPGNDQEREPDAIDPQV